LHEIICSLSEGAFLLDLGSGSGSFDRALTPAAVIRVDVEESAAAGETFVRADAAALPFRGGFFDALILNHSLEHFAGLDGVLHELGRVVKSRGALYVAIPDANSLCDRLYRWLGRGGGHVNRFTDPRALERRIERATGLRHVATRVLLTSFTFLNRRSMMRRPPRRLALAGGGSESVLVLASGLLRLADRVLRSRLSVYGWAMYFGEIPHPVEADAWANVCVRCGAGHPSGNLDRRGLFYLCPRCGARNIFTPDSAYRRLTWRRPAPQPEPCKEKR